MQQIRNNESFISYKYQNSQRRYCTNCDRTAYSLCVNEYECVNIQLVFEISTEGVLQGNVFLKKFCKFYRKTSALEIPNIPPSAFYPNWAGLGKPNLARMSLIECYYQRHYITAFTFSELLRENQHGRLNYPPPTFGLRSISQDCCNDIPKFGISAAIMLSGRYLPQMVHVELWTLTSLFQLLSNILAYNNFI